MTNAMYDMLIGHEVSHALYTPQGGEWVDASNRVAGGLDHTGTARHYLNVVEDARIERLIKIKFPGLRRDFIDAYKQFAEDDIFEIAGKDLNDLMLIDRLNIHYKIGHLANVPFAASERVWIDRIDEANEWHEIVDIATELWTDAAIETDLPESTNMPMGEFPDAPGEDADGPGGTMGPAGEQSDDDSEDSEGRGEGGTAEDDEDAEEGNEGGTAGGSGEDDGASADDDTDDGESADGQNRGSACQAGAGVNETAPERIMDAPMPETSQAMETAIASMRDSDANNISYQRVPDLNLDKIVIDYTNIADCYRDMFAKSSESVEKFNECAAAVRTFENDCRKTTNMLVKQFEMKMAADQDKRTSTAKTGILDTNTMINYRWSEDIFLRMEEVADGKNHGLVMVIDWSGSMQDCLRETVEQLLSLVFFCKKVNIPYEVYSFTNEMPFDVSSRYNDHETYDREVEEYGSQVNAREDDDMIQDYSCQNFILNNLLSSRMNTREFKTACALLWYMMEGETWSNGIDMCGATRVSRFRLSGTPLHEAMFALGKIVPEFREQHGVQIVNTVVLTDGEAGGCNWGQNYLLDPETKKTFKIDRSQRFTGTVAEWLQDKTGANVIGIYMTDTVRGFNYKMNDHDFNDFKSSFTKNNFASLPSSGWTEYFVVKSNTKVENDAMDDLPEDATFARLKNAFAKSAKTRTTSRVLLARFIDLIAA